jgi:hypothetical protein
MSDLRNRMAALAAGSALLALAARADSPPVQMDSSYARETSSSWTRHQPAENAPCSIWLADVRDLREDTQAAGSFSGRFVHAEDAPAWLRSGLLSLSRDPRLSVVNQRPNEGSNLVISIDLLKVYMLSINEAKSANVVIRVHYDPASGRPTDQVYRGAFTSVNWTGADGEARGALDVALSKVLDDLGPDLLKRCVAVSTGR